MNTPFDEEPPQPKKPGRFAGLRASFLTGLVVIAPVGLTIWLMWSVIGWVDGFVLPLVPYNFNPEKYIGINLRGVGVIFFLAFTIFMGWIAKGLIGKSLISISPSRWSNGCRLCARSIPASNRSPKRFLPRSERSFEKACLIQYPRKGIWAIGFISTTAKGEVAEKRRKHRRNA